VLRWLERRPRLEVMVFEQDRVPRVDEWFAADRAQAALLPGNRRRHRAHPG
jgi:hypothetical protein